MEEEFGKEIESNEANNCLLREKREEIGVEREHRQALVGGAGGAEERERERQREGERKDENDTSFGGGLNHSYGSSPFELPLTNYLASSGLMPTFGLSQGPPLCTCASFIQDGFQSKGLWEVDRMDRGLVPLLSLTPEEAFFKFKELSFLDLKSDK